MSTIERGLCCGIIFAGLLAGGVGAAADVGAEAREDSTRGNTFIPFPFLFYQPETKTGGGAALTLTTRRADAPDERPSTWTAMALYTQKKQYTFGVAGDVYGAGERDQITGGAFYSRFPTTFYGVGRDTEEEVSEDYTSRALQMEFSLQRRIAPRWRTGPRLEYNYEKMRDVEAGGLIAAGTLAGSEGGTLFGIGWAISRDDRDNIFWPTKGSLASWSLLVSDGSVGSDFDYVEQVLDLRRYLKVGDNGVIALRLVAKNQTATPPFQGLLGLGGDTLLRGYYEGRFRDRNLLAAQAEYRVGHWHRTGLAVFAGAGQVAHRPGDFRSDEIRSVYGLGLRFLLSSGEGINLRADYGMTDEGESNFYMAMMEAF